jgi:hypothetical protein
LIDELGGCADVVGFEIRPWVSSANFTNSSPRNIEFGFWTKDPALLKGTGRFLTS